MEPTAVSGATKLFLMLSALATALALAAYATVQNRRRARALPQTELARLREAEAHLEPSLAALDRPSSEPPALVLSGEGKTLLALSGVLFGLFCFLEYASLVGRYPILMAGERPDRLGGGCFGALCGVIVLVVSAKLLRQRRLLQNAWATAGIIVMTTYARYGHRIDYDFRDQNGRVLRGRSLVVGIQRPAAGAAIRVVFDRRDSRVNSAYASLYWRVAGKQKSS